MPPLDSSFSTKSDVRGFFVALRSILLYAVLLILGFSFDTIYLWIPLWLLGAFLFSSFFSLLHWSIHYSLFKTRILNDCFGRLFALLSLDSFVLYKYWHYVHHEATTTEGDSEGFNIRSLHSYVTSLFRYAINHYTRYVEYYQTLLSNVDNKQKYFAASRTEFFFDIALLAMWTTCVAIATYFYPLALLKGYFAPMFLSLPLLFFLDLAEHHGTRHDPNSPFSATRTITGNTFTRFLTVYSNYHLEHHLYPSVAFFHMPRIRREVAAHAVYIERTYFAFHRALLYKLFRS